MASKQADTTKVTINHKYLVWNDASRYYLFSGGRGSGKSFAVAFSMLYLTMERGHTILFTRYTLRSAHISIIPEFKEKIDMLELNHMFDVNKDEITNLHTGSKILFRGIKTSSGLQTANLKSLQGLTTWVMDEAEELTDEETFDKIDMSVRQRNIDNRVILILNPTTKEHWIYKRFFEDNAVNEGTCTTKNDVTYVHTTYLDNLANLSQSYINSIEKIKRRRPNKYKHQILGGWLDKAEGVVFDNWTIGEFQHVSKSVFGQDFGFSNDPSTLIEANIDDNNQKIYVRLHYYKPHLTTSQIGELNKRIAGGGLIVADSSEPRLINELRSYCNIVPAVKGQGSVTFGISMLKDYDLIIDPESTDMIKELNNYVWLEKKSQTPCDAFNHSLDALRYAVSFKMTNKHRGIYHIY